MARYSFYNDDKKIVVCVSSYAGKKVRATAKCDPKDAFNYNSGCLLAKGRVDAKIAKKRQERAYAKVMSAQEEVNRAKQRLEDMESYYAVSCAEKEVADNALANLLKTL